MDIPAQRHNWSRHMCLKMKQFFDYNIKHITGIPNHPTGQAVIEKSNKTKGYAKQRDGKYSQK